MNKCMEMFQNSRRDGISGDDRNGDLVKFGKYWNIYNGAPRDNRQMMDETIARLLNINSHRENANQNHNRISLHIH